MTSYLLLIMAICSLPKKAQPFFRMRDEDFRYLNSEKSLSRKMYILDDILSLTNEEHIERERIVTDILHMLRPYYPQCEIKVFGSSVNGFGFKGCDLDLLFIPFPRYCNMDFKNKGSGTIPPLHHVLIGTFSKNRLYQMNEESHLQFIKRILFTQRQYFKKVFYIPAKCPILNIEFVYSPLHCDLSASNRLVLYNTQLLWIYGKLDRHVKPLVMFIRFWAKSLGFISKSLLSSYCLTLLVIFYLQNTVPAVLPSVKYLNKKAGYSRIIDGWETALCEKLDVIRMEHENRKYLSDLLMEFFDFYWEFDFIQNIVSVYDGKPLPVKIVKQSNDERIKTFNVTPFSVQDPFILSKNISRNSTMKTPFKLSLMLAKDLLRQKDFNLKLLFDPSYYQNKINCMFAPMKNLLPRSVFLTLQLTYEVSSRLSITSNLNPWFNKVSLSVLDVLQYGLLLECDVVDRFILDDETVEPPRKKRKFSVSDIGDLKQIVSIQCNVNFPTLWRQNRTEVYQHLKKTDSSFEVEDSDFDIPASLKTEYKISKELTKDEIKEITKLPKFNSQPPYFSFACDCFRYPESQISDIVIRFSPYKSNTTLKIFNETKEFLKMFVQKQMKCIMQED